LNETKERFLQNNQKMIRKITYFIAYAATTKSYIQGVPGGMDKTSGECSLC